MTDKELYLKKKQADLDIWAADLAKLKAHASKASAEIQLELHKATKALANKMDESKTLLSDLGKSTGDAKDSIKTRIESAWNSLKCSFSDANEKCASNSETKRIPVKNAKLKRKAKV